MFNSNFPGVANPPNAYNTNTQDKRFIVRDTSIIDSSSGDKCVYCRFDDIELTNITSLTNTNSLFPTIPTVHTHWLWRLWYSRQAQEFQFEFYDVTFFSFLNLFYLPISTFRKSPHKTSFTNIVNINKEGKVKLHFHS